MIGEDIVSSTIVSSPVTPARRKLEAFDESVFRDIPALTENRTPIFPDLGLMTRNLRLEIRN
jgi:hypothetical protein